MLTFNFAETDYYKKEQQCTLQNNIYWQISPIADGNCGLYAFICGFIDAIITGQLILQEPQFLLFKRVILRNLPLESRIRDFSYSLVEPISNLIEFINHSNLSFDQFKAFLLTQNTREQLAAINIVFAQALREIGFTTYLAILGLDTEVEVLEDDTKLLEEGEWVGEEILSSLANYFGINVKLMAAHSSPNSPCIEAPLQETSIPLFSLFNDLDKKHWHYLLPTKQTNGLAQFLPTNKPLENKEEKNRPVLQRKISRLLLEDNKKRIQAIQEKKIANKASSHEPELSIFTFAKKLKQIFYFLKEIFEKETNDSREYQEALYQASFVAKDSTEKINKLRQSLDRGRLDKSLSILGLLEIEKVLIKNSFVVDDATDAVAVGLQNAEIADFLSRNYRNLPTTTMTFFKRKIAFTKILPDKRPSPLYSKPLHPRPLLCH